MSLHLVFFSLPPAVSVFWVLDLDPPSEGAPVLFNVHNTVHKSQAVVPDVFLSELGVTVHLLNSIKACTSRVLILTREA